MNPGEVIAELRERCELEMKRAGNEKYTSPVFSYCLGAFDAYQYAINLVKSISERR